MAAARLRRTFRYPEDTDDNNEGREELDDEEQEKVIKELQMQNEKRNAEYTLAFAIIPLVSAAAFLPAMLSSSATAYQRTLHFLSIVSLLATAYIMRYIPLRQLNRKKGQQGLLIREVEEDSSTPFFRKHLISANAAFCALLALASCLIGSSEQSDDIQWIPYLVPGAILGTVLVARKVMASVDVGQLEDLRYEYKGA
ncbi:hypothetical protein VTN00DRAFT_5977 [Thermoascus crustaceus]|uniref:uncharacterized protein n=1 Tax=Thermoascus crustaceus TaxID=5088 RepID=UPI003743A0B4